MVRLMSRIVGGRFGFGFWEIVYECFGDVCGWTKKMLKGGVNWIGVVRNNLCDFFNWNF